MTIPTIGQCMTPDPIRISRDLTLEDAAARMFEHGFRHLLVYTGDTLEGIVSDRDVALLGGLKAFDRGRVPIHEMMTRDPLTCPASTPLDEALDLLCDRKISSLVVEEGGEVVGIFTTIDAMRELRDRLRA